MKRYYSISLLSALIALSSCTDKFFDLEPANNVSVGKVYRTAADYDLAVVSCYSKLQTQVHFYTECCEFRSDNLNLSAPTAGTQDRYDIDHFNEKPSNGLLDTYWASFSNNVYRCNMILDRIDGATFDETLKKQYKAEALFIRALTYFNMYRVWGGVPTARKVVTTAEALRIPRSSNQEMFEFIAGDLKQIVDEQMLPESYTGTNIGRATLGAAKTLLGKVYLTFHKWAEARDVLSEVIGKYELMNPIEKVFDVENKMNREIIFAVRFNKEIEGEGHSYWFNITNLTDETNQSASLLNSFEVGDSRKEMITYISVVKNVCLMNKFKDTRSSTYNTVGNDQILLRYADVLLMYAEALNEIGYDASAGSAALARLNDVRERAGLNRLNNTDVTSQENFRRALLKERQREFPYEGHRWFDLIRMGYAVEAMKIEGFDIQTYQLLFPIPQNEIEKVGDASILWQNPGYDDTNEKK